MSFTERIRGVFRMFFLFTVLVAVAVLSAITTIRLTIHGGIENLPDVTGMPLLRADEVATSLGLEMKTIDRLYSKTVPEGQIISQVPQAGTQVKPGQELQVLVSLGPPKVSVPNVVGGSLRAARLTAIQQGLTIGDIAAVYWPGSGAGEVLEQDPPPQTTDLHSPALNFLVSLGDPAPAYVCPDFIGHLFPLTRASLIKIGIQIIQENPVTAPNVVKGTIIAQTPSPGSRITTNTPFSFAVAN